MSNYYKLPECTYEEIKQNTLHFQKLDYAEKDRIKQKTTFDLYKDDI